jgi:ABC-2 type transport system ATP-binding protein
MRGWRIAIETSGLTKRFGRPSPLTRLAGRRARRAPVNAVLDVSLSIEPGEVVAVLGPNGSGKSTLLRILATLIAPDAGSARVAGHDVVVDDVAVRRNVALVTTEDRSFSMRLTGRQNLELFAALHDVDDAAMDEALDRVDLRAAAHDMFSTYSSGMRQRLALARGLMTAPRVLLLDEPFRALDDASSATLQASIADAARGGACALVATHHVDELGDVCQRVISLRDGRVVA